MCPFRFFWVACFLEPPWEANRGSNGKTRWFWSVQPKIHSRFGFEKHILVSKACFLKLGSFGVLPNFLSLAYFSISVCQDWCHGTSWSSKFRLGVGGPLASHICRRGQEQRCESVFLRTLVLKTPLWSNCLVDWCFKDTSMRARWTKVFVGKTTVFLGKTTVFLGKTR